MILEDQNSIGSQAWEDRKEELDREIARHHAAQDPGAAGEETPDTATTGADSSSALSSPPPAPGFPTSYTIERAAFVIGIDVWALQELIGRDFCTVLVSEDGREFITLAQLDRLDDFIGILERGKREVAA